MQPLPFIGAVVRYGYVWAEDASSGRPATKDRPVLIVDVHAVPERTIVSVCPITHMPPAVPSAVIELGEARVRRRAGLDDDPQRIVCSEINEFDWPSPEVVPSLLGDLILGRMDDEVTRRARHLLADRIELGSLRSVQRPRA